MARILHSAFCITFATLVTGCGGLKLPDPLKPQKNDWPVFGMNDARINATEERVSPPLSLAWEYDITSGMGSGSPIVIDSVVLVTNLRGEMYAISANTGKRIGWIALGDAIQGSPAIDGSMAYVAITNSRESLVAFDLYDGKTVWKKAYGDLEVTPLLLGQNLYVGNTTGMFFCVDRKSGDLAWRFRLPGNTTKKGIRSSAAAADSTLVVFGGEDGSVYALDARSGAERWSYGTGSPIFASPAVHNGVVYCGNDAGRLFALSTENGQPVWQFDAGGSIYATPSFAGNRLLIGTTAGMLYALDAAAGTMIWSKEFNSVINSSAVVSGMYAYIGTLRKELYAVNVADGSIAWNQKLEGRIKTSPAIANGKVFVATDNKLILAFTPSLPAQ